MLLSRTGRDGSNQMKRGAGADKLQDDSPKTGSAVNLCFISEENGWTLPVSRSRPLETGKRDQRL